MSVFLSIYDFYDKRWGETALQKKIDEANARAERAHAEGMTQGRAKALQRASPERGQDGKRNRGRMTHPKADQRTEPDPRPQRGPTSRRKRTSFPGGRTSLPGFLLAGPHPVEGPDGD